MPSRRFAPMSQKDKEEGEEGEEDAIVEEEEENKPDG
jgi:hypothetical protein